MIVISVSLVVQVGLMDFSRRFWLSEIVQNLIPFGFTVQQVPEAVVNPAKLIGSLSHFFPKTAGVDVMNSFKAPGAVISPGVSEICRPFISLVKSFNHLFDDFKIGRPVAVINFQEQLLCQRP